MNRSWRWLLGAALLLGLAAAGLRWRAASLRSEALAQWQASLNALADAGKLAITSWLHERLADGEVAAEYAAGLPEAFAAPEGSTSSALAARDRLRRHLQLLHQVVGYPALWILDRTGQVAAALPFSPVPDSAELAVARRALRDGAAHFGHPWLAPDSSVSFPLAVPISGFRQPVLGAVLIRINPAATLFPLLQARQRLGTTADLRLVVRLGDDVALLTPSPEPAAGPLKLRIPWEQVSAVSQFALSGRETFGAFISSTGVPILAATRHIPETGWGLISRVEQREAFAAARGRLRNEAILAVALLTSFVLALLAINRSARLAQWRERVEAARALEASERGYRELVESSLGLIYTHDLAGRIRSVNPAAAQALGLDGPEAAVGRPLEEFLPPAARAAVPEYLARIRASGRDAGLFRVLTRDGRERVWEYRNVLVREPAGEPYVLGHARDVTEREEAEAALRRSEHSYRSLVEHAVYGIYRSTLDGRLVAVNPALVRMLGYDSEAELLAVDMARDLYADPEERARLIQIYRDRPYVEGVEVDWKRKDGSPIRVRLSGTSVRNEQGEVEGFEMMVENITERYALESRLRQAQKLEAVGQLTGGIAHDFNNLLTVILANAELIDRGLLPEQRELKVELEDLRAAARRGAAMVRKLLAFTRREELKLQPVDLAKLVGDLTEILRRLLPESISVVTEVAKPAPPPARADPGAVEQILLNLVTNARDAMPRGGTLRLSVAPAVLDDAYRAAHGWGEPGRYVRLSVADTGIGMDQATMAHLFEPFFTTKPPGAGTGLGLAMVYGLVKQQGGFVGVASQPGQGTTVEVYLPLATAPASAQPAGTGAELPGGRETILLVEDEDGIRRSASRILSRFGYRVLVAADGEEALEVYRQHAGAIDLVLSDVVMPRMSGSQLYQLLRREARPPKFLFTSGYAAREIEDRTVLEEAGPLLQKPWTVEELLRRVRQVLDGA